MGRHYANVATAIWKDRDFLALPHEAKCDYLMYVTQSNISAAGTLPLTINRWAELSPDRTPEDVRRVQKVLEEARFVVVDERKEELLVRSFVRHDKGYSNPKRRPAILEAAREVVSPKLRRALAVEFARLNLPTAGLVDGPDDPGRGATEDPTSWPVPQGSWGPADDDMNRCGPSDGPRERHPDAPPIGDDPPEPDIEPVDNKFSQVNSLSIGYSGNREGLSPSDRVVVTKGPYVDPTTHNPSSSSRARRIVADVGADDDETTAVIAKIQADYRPNDLGAYAAALKRNGDLAAILAEVRAGPPASPAYAGPRCDFEPDESGLSCSRCNALARHPCHGQRTGVAA